MSELGRETIPLGPEPRILLVRNDNIGDVVCTLPAVTLLRKRLPNAYIGILVCRLTEEVVSGHPDIDRVFVYDKAKHIRPRSPLVAWRGMLGMFGEIRREGFDVAVGLKSRYSGSQGWLVFMSRAPLRIGRRPGARGLIPRAFFNRTLPEDLRSVHEAVKTAMMLAPLGVDPSDPPPARISLAESDFREFREFLLKRSVGDKRPLIMVNVSGRPEEGRTWPGPSFIMLVRNLREMGMEVLFSSAPPDEPSVRRLAGELDPLPPVFSTRRLKSFAAAISLCDIFVTVQGGPMHLAAAAARPVVGLFGRQDPEIWHPWKVDHRVLKKDGGLSAIEPSEVARAALELAQTLELER